MSSHIPGAEARRGRSVRDNSVLLIDLENFFRGREEQFRKKETNRDYDFAHDLDELNSVVADFAGPRRLVVRRAYADFNTRNKNYVRYLRKHSETLMSKGIEPIQVFRFPGGGNKNAADMRLALDASDLMSERKGIGQFILVTGDSDFIPLVLDLKRRGAEVAVIGITGSTKRVLAPYCDRFEYFEDLVGSRCERRSGANGDHPKPHLAIRVPAALPSLNWAFKKTAQFDSHSTSRYVDLFQCDSPKITLVPLEQWQTITDRVFQSASNGGKTRPTLRYRALVGNIASQCASQGMKDADRCVQGVLAQLFVAGCFFCAEPGNESGKRNFHWKTQAAQLDREITHVEELRTRTQHYLIRLLTERLQKEGVEGSIKADVLGELFYGPRPSPEQVDCLRKMIDDTPQSQTPEGL